jgi:hypothetical protein
MYAYVYGNMYSYVCECLCMCVSVCMNMCVCVCKCAYTCVCLRVLERVSRHCASHRYKNVRTNPIELPTAGFLVYSPCVCEAKDLSIRTKVVASFVRYEKGIRNVWAVYFYYLCNIGIW